LYFKTKAKGRQRADLGGLLKGVLKRKKPFKKSGVYLEN
jgi:hypothetical protein